MNRKKRLDKEILSLSKVINALNNKNRLTLLGLLYLESVRSFTNMANETKIDSNKLAYHLNILINTKLIFKKDDKYALTNEGEDVLTDIGFVEEIKELVESKPLEKPIVKNEMRYLDISDSIKKMINPIQDETTINYFLQSSVFNTEIENYFKGIQSGKEYLKNKIYVDSNACKSSKAFFIKIDNERYLKNLKGKIFPNKNLRLVEYER